MPKVEKMDLDSSLKETITYESQMLHYGLYTAGYQRVFQADIPWHWHDEFELGYYFRRKRSISNQRAYSHPP